ncbi:MAG: ATP-dependent zinc metalloprotease FtsH [Gemmataceae bacterium]|nr:ATP-dependent zinc metalloprotease FtsH [Gemmataceae bacterium]
MPRPNPRPLKKPKPPAPIFPGSVFLLGLIAVAVLAVMLFPFGASQSIRYDQFEKLLNENKLKKVVLVGNDRVLGDVRDEMKLHGEEELRALKIPSGSFSVRLLPAQDRKDLYEAVKARGVAFDTEDDRANWFGQNFMSFLFATVLFMMLISFFLPRLRDPMGGGMPTAFGRSPARKYDKNAKTRTTFADVADMESAKRELQEIVDFLRSPEKFLKLGAQIPKGVLLVGPPGTGKTLLARAVAGEANAQFFSINGAEFIQMFVGVGASRVRDLFKNAKENAPCLIFIDEIDAVGRMRGAGVGGGSDEREQTLNQILGEMDGFTATDAVIVIAATNRPDVLDTALLRPGRFDRHVTIERPTWKGRLDILKVHTRNKPLGDDVDLEALARSTIGMTGADLRNLANEAALLAARENKSRIDKSDFHAAMDRVILGPKREEGLTEADKRRIAYHEAGHALVAFLEPEAEKPHKVSIVPRSQSLGVNLIAPDEIRVQKGLAYFKAKLAFMMGGRAADRLVYGETDAGHESDLKQATKLARYMVTHWGMSDRLGPMSFRVGEEHVFLGKELQEARDFSEGTMQVIDEEVSKLLREADARAFEHLSQHRATMDRIVDALLQTEELDKKELEALVAPVVPAAQPSGAGTSAAPAPTRA